MFAFERSSTSPFGQTNSVFGQNNSCNNPFAPKPFGSTTPFGSQTGSSIFGGTSTGVFGAAQTPSPFGASCSPAFGSSMPAFGSSSTPAFGSSSTSFGGSSGFGQKPAFGGFGCTPTQTNPFGSATQPSQPVFGSSIFGSSTPFGASSQPAFGSTGAPAFGATSTPAFGATSTPSFGGTSIPAFGATSAPTFGATSTPAFVPTLIPAFGSTGRLFGVSNASFGGGGAFGSSSPFGSKTSAFRGAFGLQTPTSDSHDIFSQLGNISDSYPVFIGQTGNISRVSDLAITEEDGGTSGQTAKLESISAMPAYKDLKYESCVAIAGADYCVIAADYTHDHTKISQINEKSVMASCGFQAGVKDLQEVLSAGNLIYKHLHNKPMSCPAMTKLLSRLWKYDLCYASIVLGGLDSEGKGCVFTHDDGASSRGISGAAIITPPILQYKLPAKDVCTRLSETEAVDLAKTIFASTTRTGDKLEIVVLNASGLRREYMDLRKD